VKSRAADIVLAVLLALASLLLYRKVTRLFWTYDDAFLVHVAIEHPARDHFIGSALWSTLPQPLFTPLLTATYDAELSLFGLKPAGFYAVDVTLIALLAVVVFVTLRLWWPPGASAAAALLFIAGAPVCAAATKLMVVHYIESLILGTIAIALFVVSVRRSITSLSIVSAVFYLAAMLAKEVAVPIIAILALLPVGNIRSRVRSIAPHLVALLIYALWRRADLGMWFGGYGWRIRATDIPSIVAAFPAAVWEHIAGPSLLFGSAMILLVAGGIALRMRSAADTGRILAVLALTIAPFLPMARKFESRFVLAFWLACAVIAVAGFLTLKNRSVTIAMLIIAPVLALVVNRQVWAGEFARSQRMSDESRVFFDLGAGDALRQPSVPPAAMNELQWLKETRLHRASGTTWFDDDIYLCEHRPLPRRVFSYDASRRAVIQRGDMDAIRNRYCSSIRPNAALNATFHHEGETLYWELGPYRRGEYAIVIGEGVQAFDVPASDAFRLPHVTALKLRVRYNSPDGWVTYSPELSLDFTRSEDLQWRR
jgi:hypothetical protein